MELWDAGHGTRRGQGVPALPPQERLAIWEGVSDYIVWQLMLSQGVRIIRLGTFSVVREQVVGGKRGLLTVRRPMFHLSKNIAQVLGLSHDEAYAPGHKEMEPLKCARIASDMSVPRQTVEACVEETLREFCRCLKSGQNVAFVLKDVGMLVIQGTNVKMRFYKSLLQRLNGTEQRLAALLGMPEMRDSVLSRTKTAASQTLSGRVFVFPEYKLESVARKPPVRPMAAAKATQAEERGKADCSGRKGNLPANHLLLRERLPARRLTALNMEKGKGDTGKGKAPPGSVLPAIGESSLRKVEKGRRKPSAEESSAKPKEKKERAALKATRDMEESEGIQVRRMSRTLTNLRPDLSLPTTSRDERADDRAGEKKPSIKDVYIYHLGPEEEMTVYVYFSHIDEEEKKKEQQSSQETVYGDSFTCWMMEEWEEYKGASSAEYKASSTSPKRMVSKQSLQALQAAVTSLVKEAKSCVEEVGAKNATEEPECLSVLPAIRESSSRKVEKGRRKPSAEESSAKPKEKKERAALKATRDMEDPEGIQVRRMSRTLTNLRPDLSLPTTSRDERADDRAGEKKPSIKDVYIYHLGPEEEMTVYVYFSHIDEEEKKE
ncbi:coiled-coil domain-containing protein 81-like [Dromaius novaehollandiae]|uniref:coiled-coil domain-containing protein 81-like n=1 Tax=Dromaius novaehollandiae TaxID=8790 RepID=UPI0031204AA7